MSGVEAFNEIAHDSAVELLEPLFFSEELASKVVEARPFTNVQSAVDVMNLQLGTLPGSAVKKVLTHTHASELRWNKGPYRRRSSLQLMV